MEPHGGLEHPEERDLRGCLELRQMARGEVQRERAMLIAQLQQAVSDEEIEDIRQFAARIAAGLEIAEQQFKARRRIIEDLDVWAILSMEDGHQVARVWCMLGEDIVQLRQQSTVICIMSGNAIRRVAQIAVSSGRGVRHRVTVLDV